MSTDSGPDRSSAEWDALISEAIETPGALLSNFRITRVHYLLSCELLMVIGPSAGANFHSWAVWGSRKAGVTIRQEDKDQASRDATIVAGIVGAVVGVGVGWLVAAVTGWPLLLSIAGWILCGNIVGGGCGYLLAGYTRRTAARLVLEGNRIVLDVIGRESARYLGYVQAVSVGGVDVDAAFADFLAKFRPGPTENGGQDLLRRAFEKYEMARRSSDAKVRHECNYFANCLAVLHEHIRLQPFISQSLPFLISKCVTQRLMTYSVGAKQLAVHEDVPPLANALFPETLTTVEQQDLREFLDGEKGWDVGRGKLANTRAQDWTDLRQRMGYIVNLFRTQHTAADVMMSPYSGLQLEMIGRGELPGRPW